MKKKVKSSFIVTGLLFLLFVLFTVVVSTVDVRPIGPEGSEVGLAMLNGFVFQKFGVHMIWYSITDRLGVVALLTAFCFAIIGLIQIVNKKSLLKVDIRIILLGIYYVIVIAAYVFFEIFIINYRPIILEESVGLEASYPSSHTMLVICIMGSANVLFQQMIQNKMIRVIMNALSVLVIVVTAVGRMISGVHWFTDIVGGMLLGITMIQLYASVLQLIAWKKENNKEI
ncbi:MAG: phosphatase PAP2 family protein [Lachnospiraceae bacterium]|nr:phosphatase PAP2 family protein [Lachnospiraceae bacterium]